MEINYETKEEFIATFEIEWKLRKKGLFKKMRSYMAIYNDHIPIELDENIYAYNDKDIIDIYIK